MLRSTSFLHACVVLSAGLAGSAGAAVYTMSVDGADAVFLAGRTDVVIPDPSQPWNTGTHLLRHGGPTPEEAIEQRPSMVAVSGGDVIRVLDPTIGGINFFNGFGPPFFGPDGNTGATSSLTALDGISGYLGPQGPLTAVFLSDAIPSSGPAPATLDFSTAALRDFTTLSPALAQVFYIGDGMTSGGTLQEFIAPAGATRLFFGIPDGFGFNGAPGAYDDNDGTYRIRVGVNEVPTLEVPAPATLLLAGLALAAAAGVRRRR